jgi:hypothetical protein
MPALGAVVHISSKLQTWSINPASIARVTRNVECVRPEIEVEEKQCNHVVVIVDFL